MGTALYDVSSRDRPPSKTTRSRSAKAVRRDPGTNEAIFRMKVGRVPGRPRSTFLGRDRRPTDSHDNTGKAARMTRRKPSVSQRLFVRIADNLSLGLLTVLTLLFAALGLFLPLRNQDGARWALDAAKLCLGALLGMFARRKRA